MGILESTIIYLVTFVSSYFFTKKASANFQLYDETRDSQFYRTALFLSLIAIIIPAILAGVRADSVGRDTNNYVTRWFLIGKKSKSLSIAISSLGVENILYASLSFFCGHLFSDAGSLLFFSQLLVVAPIFYCAYKHRNEISLEVSLIVYFFCFYNNSFNIVKQSIACAFVMVFYQFLSEKKMIEAIFFGIIACLFHVSAIFALGVICIVLIIDKKKKSSFFSFKNILILILLCFGLSQIEAIVNYGVSQGIIPEKYIKEIFATLGGGDSTFNTRLSLHVLYDFMFRIMLFVLPVLLIRNNEELAESASTISLIAFIGLVTYGITLLMYKSVYGGRITLYLDFFYLLWVPQYINGKRIKFGIKDITKISLGFLLLIYWFGWVMVAGWSASNHYMIRF